VSEEEIHAVSDFIRENNPLDFGSAIHGENGSTGSTSSAGAAGSTGGPGGIGAIAGSGIANVGAIAGSDQPAPSIFDEYAGGGDDDDLYEDAIETVRQAGKASASLLQRRLKVGYARAARLLDLMEERGAIGPGDGAKPREVFLDGARGTGGDIGGRADRDGFGAD